MKQRKPALDRNPSFQVVGLTRSQNHLFTKGSSRGKFHPGQTHNLKASEMSGILKKDTSNLSVYRPFQAPELVTKADVSLDVDSRNTVVIKGNVIERSENGMFCLNSIYKALGSPPKREPNEFFRRKLAQDFLVETEKLVGPNLYETVSGGMNQGTYAHELVAQRYAVFVEPSYELLIHVVFRAEEIRQKEVMKLVLQQEREEKLALEEHAKLVEGQAKAFKEKAKEAEKLAMMARSPNASNRKSAMETAKAMLENELNVRKDNDYNATTILGFVGKNLEKLHRSIPKENAKVREELESALRSISQVIQILNQED